MSSKPSSRRNSQNSGYSVVTSQASSTSRRPAAPLCASSSSSRGGSKSGTSSLASFSQKSVRSSRRSSTDSAKSIDSTNESLFSSTGSVPSAKSTNSVNSVRSGVIPALYGKLDALPALAYSDSENDSDNKPTTVEEATVHRSGRAGVRQYTKQTFKRQVDPDALNNLMDGYKPSERRIRKSYKLRCKHKDAARGTDQLVVDAGFQFPSYIDISEIHRTYGKRQQERRDFARVADNLGLRPGTLDQCDIKKVMKGKAAVDDKQKNAVWNACHEPDMFHKGIEEAALSMTGGITGLTGGGAEAKPIHKFITRGPRIIMENGRVVLGKIHGEVYEGHKDIGQGMLGRTITRMSNKQAEIKAGIGFGIQEEKVMIDGNGKVTRKSLERMVGRLPESDDAFEQMLEDTWRKATPRKASSATQVGRV